MNRRLSLAARSACIYMYLYIHVDMLYIHMYIFVLLFVWQRRRPTRPNRFSEDESNTPNQKGGGWFSVLFQSLFVL